MNLNVTGEASKGSRAQSATVKQQKASATKNRRSQKASEDAKSRVVSAKSQSKKSRGGISGKSKKSPSNKSSNSYQSKRIGIQISVNKPIRTSQETLDLLDESTNQKPLLEEKKRSSLDHMKIESPHATESDKIENSPS